MTYIHNMYILSPTVFPGTNSVVAERASRLLETWAQPTGIALRRDRAQTTAHSASTSRLAS